MRAVIAAILFALGLVLNDLAGPFPVQRHR